jgi:hypothetical protein
MINDLNEIIGMECTHIFADSNCWDEKTTIRCKIIGFDINLEDKFPYSLSVNALLLPLKTTKEWEAENKGSIDEEIECMQVNGRSIDSIMFD